MIKCPYCGTNYLEFQPNCSNCGASLPLPVESPPVAAEVPLLAPPLAPRALPSNYIWRVIFSDGWAIAGSVFLLLGAIFSVVGIALTVAIVTIFIGLPFAGLGLLFLAAGAALLVWRLRETQRTAEVVQEGIAVLGKIDQVRQNLYVQVNGRYPWTINYHFVAGGQEYHSKVTTLSQPDLSQKPGRDVYVLYLPDEPARNTIYPHPYGFYET